MSVCFSTIGKVCGSFAGASALVLGASAVHADVLAEYEFAGESLASTDNEPNAIASDFSAGNVDSGWRIRYSGFQPHSADTAVYNETRHTGSTFQQADDLGAYWSFTVTPDPGWQMDLQSLSFYASVSQGDSPDAVRYHTRSSLDDFQSDIDTYDRQWTPFSQNVVDLSGSTFQELDEAVEFRIYATLPEGSTREIARLDSVSLEGTVVPEPGSLALVAAGGLMLLGSRRRRANAST